MKVIFPMTLLLTSPTLGRIVQRNEYVPVRFQGISLSDFLDRETPASNSPPLLELPTPVDGRTCPPAIEFMGESTLEILVIPIENGGCYEFKTPFYNQGGYPRATYHSYQCTYEIQLPAGVTPTFFISSTDFRLQDRNASNQCANDVFILKNIVKNGNCLDDAQFQGNENEVHYCGRLTSDKSFTIKPEILINGKRRFQIIFKADEQVQAKGVRGILCL